MHLFHILGMMTTLAAIFAYLNQRFIRLPMTVGLMLQSLILAGILILLNHFGLPVETPAREMVEAIHFDRILLEVVLSFLLFSGALFAELDDLKKVKLDITLLVLVGVTLSTILVAVGLYAVTQALGIEVRLVYCFLFGALISPTDPVAVLATLKSLGIGNEIEARIAGEALFNDGVGIVLFLSLTHVAAGEAGFGIGNMALLFVREALGGIGLGILIGWAGYVLLKTLDNYPVEILITLAMVSGGYTLAHALHVSGPLAMVIAGLMIGSHGRTFAMSEMTEVNLDRFWEVVEDALNAILFTLIGLEILALWPDLSTSYLAVGGTAIVIVLLARFLSVGGMSLALTRFKTLPRNAVPLLTWSGVRGGISIALALSIASVPEREVLIVATYMVAIFSLLVQGTTVKYLVHS